MFKEAGDCSELEYEAQELYIYILRTANEFLINAQSFSIEVLQRENPTYEELAKLAKDVAELIRFLADDFDPMMHPKALEYASLMREMGKAITAGDEEELERVVEILDGKPML